ncbi:MAG: hypothetical protein ACREIT_01670 [Tepidisphaeraceae bacterium]
MKRFITLMMLGMFSFALLGCEASGRVGDDDMDDGDVTYKKKTTTVNDDGDRTVKTEIRRDVD